MHKNYPRLDKLALPDVESIGELRESIKTRKSFRDFAKKGIDKKTLSDILYHSLAATRCNPNEEFNPFRVYPSAGAKYPIEAYVLIIKGRGIKKGLYHYNPINHELEVLLKTIKTEDIDNIWMPKQRWFKNASVLIILTSIFHRTTDKYKKRGVLFPYIEAGHIVQNIYLLSASFKIGCCAIGMLNEKSLIKLLDINSRDEYPIYYVVIGS